jgi:hypothetical protein
MGSKPRAGIGGADRSPARGDLFIETPGPKYPSKAPLGATPPRRGSSRCPFARAMPPLRGSGMIVGMVFANYKPVGPTGLEVHGRSGKNSRARL